MQFTKQQFWIYIRRALWVTFAWVLISNALFYSEYLTLIDNNALTSDFDFALSFRSYLLVSIIAGIIGGTVTLHLMEWLLRKYAFRQGTHPNCHYLWYRSINSKLYWVTLLF